MTYDQGSEFICITPHGATRVNSSGKKGTSQFKAGDKVWVISPHYEQKRDGAIAYARKGKSSGDQFRLANNTFDFLFKAA